VPRWRETAGKNVAKFGGPLQEMAFSSCDNQGIEAVARAIRVALVRAADANSATNRVASGALTLARLCAQR
jgi:hypothetical protein